MATLESNCSSVGLDGDFCSLSWQIFFFFGFLTIAQTLSRTAEKKFLAVSIVERLYRVAPNRLLHCVCQVCQEAVACAVVGDHLAAPLTEGECPEAVVATPCTFTDSAGR